MSDILEDQKIHFIVKDYRRMFEQHNTLVSMGKELQSELRKKNAEIIILRAKVNDLESQTSKPQKPSGKVKGILNDIETMTNSIAYKLKQATESLNKVSKSTEELRQLINV
jgi:chromosome segregation ATPase